MHPPLFQKSCEGRKLGCRCAIVSNLTRSSCIGPNAIAVSLAGFGWASTTSATFG